MQNDEKQSLLGLQAASPFVSFRKKGGSTHHHNTYNSVICWNKIITLFG